MATITTINSGDQITTSRAVLNNNFSALNTDKLETSVVDVDTTLAANSDAKVASQKAIRAYVDARTSASTFACGASTYDIATASGVQNIAHGLSTTPKVVRIKAFYSNLAFNNASEHSAHAYAVYNGTTQASGYAAQNASTTATANHSIHGATFRVYGSINPAGYQDGIITVTGTNIVITWTKSGTPTGTINLVWEANA